VREPPAYQFNYLIGIGNIGLYGLLSSIFPIITQTLLGCKGFLIKPMPSVVFYILFFNRTRVERCGSGPYMSLPSLLVFGRQLIQLRLGEHRTVLADILRPHVAAATDADAAFHAVLQA